MRRRGRYSQTREVLLIAVPMLLLLGGLAWLALSFAGTAPPSRFVIAAASKGSPYYQLAKRYEHLFKTNNIELEVRETGGSLDNLKALSDPASGVDAGFVQGGLPASRSAAGLLSVGRVA
ncbi:MAG: C4-dicarboxylate ABC transporter substrate-binding protein, partial [Proteobacteria bacterium]|nr:C4-dicarboxylate ABC transporter substrate-binding protein [Pseudomonadota bacterium]